jgi:hypothetical protein
VTRAPHLSLPFRFELLRGGQRAVPVTEQDSYDEIGDCVELTLRTEQGQRQNLPAFGRPQTLAFTQDRELARAQVQQTVDDAEPRVQAIVQQGDFDPADPGVLRLLTMYEIEVEAP